MSTTTGIYLFAHILGVVLWFGVTLVLAFVTGRATRSGDFGTIAFAYRTASHLTKTVGLTGMALTVLSGFALTAALDYGYFQPTPDHWLFQMQALGVLAFAVGALYQIPLSERLARAAEASASAGEASGAFTKYRKRYALVSSVLGFTLLVIVALATLKP